MPQRPLAALAKFSILRELAGVWIESVAVEGVLHTRGRAGEKRGGDGSLGTTCSREKESTSGGGDVVERPGVRAGSMMMRRGCARGWRQQLKLVGVHRVGVGKGGAGDAAPRWVWRRRLPTKPVLLRNVAPRVAVGRGAKRTWRSMPGGAARGAGGGAVLLGGVSTLSDGSVGAVCGGERMAAADKGSTRGRSGTRVAGGEKRFVAGVASDKMMLVRCCRAIRQ